MVAAALWLAFATTLPGGATLAFGDLALPDDAPRASYFNLAHCACAQPGAAMTAFDQGTFAYRVTVTGDASAVHRPLDIWVGAGCDELDTRATSCHQVTSAGVTDLSTIPQDGATPAVSVYELMEPEPGAAGCDLRAMQATEWGLVDGDGDGVYDYAIEQPVATDALAPPAPTEFAAAGKAGTIALSWTPPDTTDVAAYQVLCATAGGAPVGSAQLSPRYTTARMLCGEPLDVPLHPADLAGATAEDIALPQQLAQLDPSYLCAEQTDPGPAGISVRGIGSDQPLILVVLAIDRAGNATATYFTSYVSAYTNVDLWHDLHDRGAATEGGFCAIGTAADRGAVVVAAIAVALRRRRRNTTMTANSSPVP